MVCIRHSRKSRHSSWMFMHHQQAVFARHPDGCLRPRHVRQLSGGERRRVALALALGYRRLAASRGRFSANLLVLDEVRSAQQ